MKKALLFLVALFVGASVYAVDFEEDGISYNILSAEDHTVEVANNNSAYVGDVVIPARVQHDGTMYTVAGIQFQAFFKCADLHSVSIPATVSDMGKYSFTQCSNLEEVELPSNATVIPDGMFWGCSALKTISLPAGVTEIGEYAFANCTSLSDINIPSHLIYIGKAALMATAITEFTLPSGITEMSPFLLALTTKLTTVTLHDKLTAIGECAFQGNTAISTVQLPASLQVIDASAFAQCPALTEITIPDGVASLPEKCFYNDMALKRIVLGKGVSTIGADCFARYKNTATEPQLSDVYLCADAIVAGGESFLDEACQHATLHVPSALVEAYRAQSGWQRFKTVTAITDGELSGIGGVSAESESAKSFYTIDGRRLQVPFRHGVMISGGKKILY